MTVTDILYELNPHTVLLPAADRAVLQLLAQQDLTIVEDPSAAAAFLACFETPATAAVAEARFTAARPAGLAQRAGAFGPLFASALTLGVLREQSMTDLNPFNARSAVTLLTTLSLVAEDLTADVTAMGAAALEGAQAETGEPLDRILRRALGDLTRIAVGLGRQRTAYVSEHLARLAPHKQPRLHLGAGGNILDGWYNIDYPPAELPLNLRWKLPFDSNSIELVFLSHLLEHLYKKRDVPRLLRGILRVLKPGGVVRIIVPDAEVYMRAYVENDEKFFAMQRRVWFTWAPRARTPLEAILGYLGAPEIPGGLTQHKYGYDFATLAVVLQDAGFHNIERSTFMGSRHDALRVDDTSFVAEANVDGRYASLFVEAQKP